MAHGNDGPSVLPQAGAVSISDASEPTELILSDSQIFGGRLATVADFFVAHLRTLIEAAQAGFSQPLKCARKHPCRRCRVE
jgi:hypothetical protein